MSTILRPVELIYRGLNRARRAWYRAGLAKQQRLPRPVVSVGNIAIGGSGKTPTVIALADALAERGLRVAILTRGFGGELSEKAGQIVVPPFDASRFGDEPVLIARRLPDVDVVVGARRWESGLTYMVQRDCDMFLLDDGFQHLQLHRDLDIVLDRPSARWHREGRSALEDADFVLRRVDRPSDDGEWTARMEASGFRQGETRRLLQDLAGRNVYVFSGLADNEQFVETVAGLGCNIVATRRFPDHHRYTPAEIGEIRSEAIRASAIPLTSEKDAVKIDDPAIAVLEASMRIPSLDVIVDRVTSLLGK
jgi:tetraacyldisaccharide 4'-kinase